MIEYTGRKTKNHRKDVISKLSDNDIEHELSVACVNHCLSFDQVCDEWIEKIKLKVAVMIQLTNANTLFHLIRQ